MTTGDRRYMIASSLRSGSEDIDKLKSALHRYGISVIFSSSPMESKDYVLEDNPKLSIISRGSYQEAIDEILFDGWTSQFAERYGLTNIELIRLRLQYELPKDKQKPLPLVSENTGNKFSSTQLKLES